MKNISSLRYLLCVMLTRPKALNTNVCFSFSVRAHSSTKIESASDVSTVPEGWEGASC